MLVGKSNPDMTISILRFGSASINMVCSFEFFSIEDDGIDDWAYTRKLFGCNTKEHIIPKITENIRILKY